MLSSPLILPSKNALLAVPLEYYDMLSKDSTSQSESSKNSSMSFPNIFSKSGSPGPARAPFFFLIFPLSLASLSFYIFSLSSLK